MCEPPHAPKMAAQLSSSFGSSRAGGNTTRIGQIRNTASKVPTVQQQLHLITSTSVYNLFRCIQDVYVKYYVDRPYI